MMPFGPGPAELTILLMFLAGLGLPLGVPPEAENPAMQHVAPEKCVMYATWATMAAPDPKSANHTEQLLAEQEVQQFIQSLDKTVGALMQQVATQNEDPKAKQLAKVVPPWVKTVTTRASAIFATRIEAAEKKLVLEGGILVDAGPSAAALAASLVEVMSSAENRPTPVTIGRSTFQRFASQEDGLLEGEVTIGAAGQYVLIGIGKNSVEGMIERVRLKKTPAWLTALQKRLPVERRASMSYINTQALVDAFLPLAGPEGARIADSLGLGQLGAIESVTGLDKQGMVSRSLMHIEGEPKGLLTLLGGSAIQPEHLDFIPKDATLAAAFSFKTQHLYNLVRHLVADNVPNGAEQFERVAGQFEEMFGQRLEADVLASLGDVWTVSMSPTDGWMGVVATIEVRDRAKLGALLERSKAMLSDVPPEQGAPRLETSKFGEHDIHMVVARGVPVRPAFCLTDKRLIIGLSPQAVRSTLGARPAEVGLFQRPELAAAFEGEGQTIAVSYQDTAKIFETTYSYIALIVPMALEGMNEAKRTQGQPATQLPFDLASLPSARSIHRHLRPGIHITRRTKDGLESESRQTFPMPNIGTAAPVAVALLLPAVQASREAARRMQSSNNLKQIMLAHHNFADTFKNFPPAHSVSKDGKPLLSWRVHILPFIEQQELYEQFHLDEPWDSEHNKKLIAKMPQIYKSPSGPAGEGKTAYLGIAGPKGIFAPPRGPTDGRMGGTRIADITDGTSNTIAVVEANNDSAVIWTKPGDFVPDEKDSTKGLIGRTPGGFQAAISDGSVRFISENIDAKMLMNLFQRNDGNAVGRF